MIHWNLINQDKKWVGDLFEITSLGWRIFLRFSLKNEKEKMGGDELHSVTLIFFFFPPFLTEKKKTQQNLITSFCWFSHIDLHYRSSLIYFTNSTHPPSLHLLFSYFIISFLSFLVSSHKSQGSRTKCRGNHQVLP